MKRRSFLGSLFVAPLALVFKPDKVVDVIADQEDGSESGSPVATSGYVRVDSFEDAPLWGTFSSSNTVDLPPGWVGFETTTITNP